MGDFLKNNYGERIFSFVRRRYKQRLSQMKEKREMAPPVDPTIQQTRTGSIPYSKGESTTIFE